MSKPKIVLPNGWYVELDSNTRDVGAQGFVFRPDGRDSASMVWARENGTLSSRDTPIPKAVQDALAKVVFDQYE